MKKNMGSTDRVIRIVLAATIVFLFFAKVISGTLGFGLLALAGILVATSYISWCPMYLPFGINTCKATNK